MLITYRRTGGLFALLTLAAVALAATVLTVAVAAALLIVAVAIAGAVLLGRAVLPRSWRHRTVPPETPWPHETIEATVVKATGSSSDERDLWFSNKSLTRGDRTFRGEIVFFAVRDFGTASRTLMARRRQATSVASAFLVRPAWSSTSF